MRKLLRWLLLLCLVAIICAFVFTSKKKRPGEIGEMRLPVGQIQPAIGFGYSHGIILAGNGSLWSWGDTGLGWPVLGNGTNTEQAVLKQIGTESNWTAIAVGQSHNLALKSDGTIWTWGENSQGQLGDGTRTPFQAAPVPSVPGNEWAQVAAGAGHSAALKRDGTLWAWGGNGWGQLGVGTTTNSRIALQVGTSTNWLKIRAGGTRTAGIQRDGSLWLWGSNPKTGNVHPVSKEHWLVPTRVSADTNWVDMSMALGIVLAIRADGTLWVMGDNASVLANAIGPEGGAVPSRVGTNTDWMACSTGPFHAVLRKKDNSVWETWAWSGGSIRVHPAPVRLNLPAEIIASAGGGPIGAAITSKGEVWTWGRSFGERKRVAHLGNILAAKFRKSSPGGSGNLFNESFYYDDPWQLAHH